eukprot:6492725-Amphidinium_carterae.3
MEPDKDDDMDELENELQEDKILELSNEKHAAREPPLSQNSATAIWLEPGRLRLRYEHNCVGRYRNWLYVLDYWSHSSVGDTSAEPLFAEYVLVRFLANTLFIVSGVITIFEYLLDRYLADTLYIVIGDHTIGEYFLVRYLANTLYIVIGVNTVVADSFALSLAAELYQVPPWLHSSFV